jgi:hypothetical protein
MKQLKALYQKKEASRAYVIEMNCVSWCPYMEPDRPIFMYLPYLFNAHIRAHRITTPRKWTFWGKKQLSN